MNPYLEDLDIASSKIDWNRLNDKTIMITGATGMIGSCLVDCIMRRNKLYDTNIKILALGRNVERASEIFAGYISNKLFQFIKHDIVEAINFDDEIDYIINAASSATPSEFAKHPVGVMQGNIIGMINLLELSREKGATLVYISSAEIYGDIDVESKKESDYGYINHLEARASYPISKKAAETLAIAYAEEYGVNVKICRLSHVFGPTMTKTDNRAASEFIRLGTAGKDIILRNNMPVIRTYTYVVDAVSGILFVLLYGNSQEAYNIANHDSIVTIKEFAEDVALCTRTKVVLIQPTKSERKGYTKIDKQVVNNEKLLGLGWRPQFPCSVGIEHTIRSINFIR